MNFFSDEMRRNPFPTYDRLRTISPLFHEPTSDSWMIFDYETVKRVLTDHDTFSSDMYKSGRGNPDWLIFFDPPRHTKQRALISKAFTPKVVAGLESQIRELSRMLLDKVIDRGEMDLAAEYAIPLPMMVIAMMLGVPREDWPQCREWSDIILKLSYAVSGGQAAKDAAAEYFSIQAPMMTYVRALIEQRRVQPQDDLLTRLVQAEVDGDHLTEAEIMGFFQLLLVAGHETTTNLINNAFLCLVDNPEQLERLRAHRELIPSAIEEALRYRTPVQYVFRASTRDVEIHGKLIPKGKLVLPVAGSANRDPQVFADPNKFDISRDPNPHIAFGQGLHFCIGAPLSRLEGRIALTDLLDRMKSFERASTEPWQPRLALQVHGPTTLPIRFEPADSIAARA